MSIPHDENPPLTPAEVFNVPHVDEDDDVFLDDEDFDDDDDDRGYGFYADEYGDEEQDYTDYEDWRYDF